MSAGQEQEAQVGLVALVARTSMGEMNQLLFHHASSTLTLIYSSIIARGASVGQIPSSPRGSIIPPAPPMKGGPLSASGGDKRPRFAAPPLSTPRPAIRR